MPYEELYRLFPEEGGRCRPGCGKCCTSLVWVARSEADAICRWIVENLREEDILKQYWHHDENPEVCPFLTPEKKCLIYPVRPFVCRQFGHLEEIKGIPQGLAKRFSQKCPEGVEFAEVRIADIRKPLEKWYIEASECGIYIKEFRDGVYTDETGKTEAIPKKERTPRTDAKEAAPPPPD